MKSVHAVFASDGKWFVARCLDYPVTTQGRTLAAAKKHLREAVQLYLETWAGEAPQLIVRDVHLAKLAVGE
jgi:predicted RNase H-like HicB family nuclease